MEKPQEDPLPVARPWQPKFGMAGLLMVMFVCSVMAAAGYYFVQFLRGGRESQLAFILFTLAAPMLLMVVVSLMRVVYMGYLRKTQHDRRGNDGPGDF